MLTEHLLIVDHAGRRTSFTIEDHASRRTSFTIEDFRSNLEMLRKLYPVKTICMHGSPLSKYDNRLLWEKYDYRDYGIIGGAL
ncbi:hypothetical protein H8E88_02285 [candidate division KSB1 bacterium]|nr:hypothetical protein [candidate division KSB1 bacterium]